MSKFLKVILTPLMFLVGIFIWITALVFIPIEFVSEFWANKN